MTSASSKVWEQIVAAFPPVLPSAPIATCSCQECQGVREDLGNLRWNEIHPTVIDRQFGSLPLLTDEAFQALLPAFLFRALDPVAPDNYSLEWTLYALCGAYEEDAATTEQCDEYLRMRIAGFTRLQHAAVRSFLKLVAGAPDLTCYHQPIAHALSAIWADVNE